MFDYEVPHKCQYDVSSDNKGLECFEPASYLVWWNELDEMWLCKDHFEFVKKREDGICACSNCSSKVGGLIDWIVRDVKGFFIGIFQNR
jgi:hypothetical protein